MYPHQLSKTDRIVFHVDIVEHHVNAIGFCVSDGNLEFLNVLCRSLLPGAFPSWDRDGVPNPLKGFDREVKGLRYYRSPSLRRLEHGKSIEGRLYL